MKYKYDYITVIYSQHTSCVLCSAVADAKGYDAWAPVCQTGSISGQCISSDFRADSRFAPSQRETALLCNDVSHWLGASLESALILGWRQPMRDGVTLYWRLSLAARKPRISSGFYPCSHCALWSPNPMDQIKLSYLLIIWTKL